MSAASMLGDIAGTTSAIQGSLRSQSDALKVRQACAQLEALQPSIPLPRGGRREASKPPMTCFFRSGRAS